MTEYLSGRAAALDAPANDGFAITPDDVADLVRATRALYVGIGGDLVVDTIGGTTLTFTGVVGGTVLPIRVTRIRATGTDAEALVGLV